MTGERPLEPGDIVRVRTARGRTLTIRVEPGQQVRNTVSPGAEHITFPGIRVRPNQTNYSFGYRNYYSARVASVTEADREMEAE